MVKRVMGRPPPEWMYYVVKMKVKANEHYTFEQLAEKLGTSYNAIKIFCARRKLPGKYEFLEDRKVQKLIALKDIKKAAEETVNAYFK